MTFCETSSDAMVQRWYLRIQHYQSEIVHIPGICNIIPDAGSRLLHLLHPNAETSQFQSIASSFCSLFSSSPAKSLRNTAELSTALASRQLTGILRDLLHDSTTILPRDAIDDCSIRNLQFNRSVIDDDTHTQSLLTAAVNACTGASEPQSSSDDWMTRPMPRDAASASTANIDPPPSSDDWISRPMPRSRSP